VGGSVKDEVESDAVILGIEPPPNYGNRATDDFEVSPENWEAVQMFLRCQTQWRSAGMGGVFGLDYGAVAWLLRLYRVRNQRAVLEDLQTMEAAVLEALAEKGS
jgi:hypothetical protein